MIIIIIITIILTIIIIFIQDNPVCVISFGIKGGVVVRVHE